MEYADAVWGNCTQYNQTDIEAVYLESGRLVSGTLVFLASL